MQFEFPKIKLGDPEHAIRRCGYGRMVNRDGQVSYVRRLDHGMLYPRFHVYLKDYVDVVQINLHLDQKAPVYEGVTAHSGEYDGEVVEREAERMQAIITGSGSVASTVQYG